MSFAHLRDELVSTGGHGDDELMLVGLFPQGPPQYRDVPREPPFFHNRVAPDLSEQFVLRDHAFPILDERKECLEDLWSQLYWLAVAQQQSLARIQGKRSEFVGGRVCSLIATGNNCEEKRRPLVRTCHPRGSQCSCAEASRAVPDSNAIKRKGTQ